MASSIVFNNVLENQDIMENIPTRHTNTLCVSNDIRKDKAQFSTQDLGDTLVEKITTSKWSEISYLSRHNYFRNNGNESDIDFL